MLLDLGKLNILRIARTPPLHCHYSFSKSDEEYTSYTWCWKSRLKFQDEFSYKVLNIFEVSFQEIFYFWVLESLDVLKM